MFTNNTDRKIHKEVIAAMFTALTMVATMVFTIPTPTLGYIHMGDAFVLLSGALLGPFYGAIAAGLGSALSDLLLGYTISAVPTFIIKGLTALIAAFFVRKAKNTKPGRISPLMIGGFLLAELNMVAGYFLYSYLKFCILNGSFEKSTSYGGLTHALSGLPFNFAQAVCGTVLALILYPLLHKLLKRYF